jgi:hypothetical protein
MLTPFVLQPSLVRDRCHVFVKQHGECLVPAFDPAPITSFTMLMPSPVHPGPLALPPCCPFRPIDRGHRPFMFSSEQSISTRCRLPMRELPVDLSVSVPSSPSSAGFARCRGPSTAFQSWEPSLPSSVRSVPEKAALR